MLVLEWSLDITRRFRESPQCSEISNIIQLKHKDSIILSIALYAIPSHSQRGRCGRQHTRFKPFKPIHIDLLNVFSHGERLDRAVGGGDSIVSPTRSSATGTEIGGGPGGGTS